MSESSNDGDQKRELERYTTRRSAMGDFYPRCQRVMPNGAQYNKSTYDSDFCYQHYQESLEDRGQ